MRLVKFSLVTALERLRIFFQGSKRQGCLWFYFIDSHQEDPVRPLGMTGQDQGRSLSSYFWRIALVLLGSCRLVSGMEVKLAWDANTEEDLAGYRVYYWLVGGFSTPKTNIFETTNTSFTVKDLIKGRRYHFYVTAFNTWGLESPPSNYVTNEVANPDRVMVNQGGWTASLSSGVTNLLANDLLLPQRDYGDKVVLMEPPREGSLELNPDGTFLYRHYGGSALQDSFRYGIRDGLATNANAPVSISIFSLSQFHVVGDNLLIEFNSDIASTYKLEWNFESPWKEGAWPNSRTMRRANTGGAGFVPFYLPQHALFDQVFYRLKYESAGTNLMLGPLGYLRQKVIPGWNYIGMPFHPPPSFRGPVKAVSPDAVTVHGWPLPPNHFNLVNGAYQYILVNTSPLADGQWWPIHYNSAHTIYVVTRGKNLQSLLQAGDQIEVRRMASLQDVFGPFQDGHYLLRPNDDPFQTVDGVDLIRFVYQGLVSPHFFYHSGNWGPAGYYRYFSAQVTDGMYGPLDRSWLTFFPGQAFELYTEQTDLFLHFFGMVQTSPFMHYLSQGYNLVSSIYPVGLTLAESGLAESGWELDDQFGANFIFQPATGYFLERGPFDPSHWLQRPPLGQN